MSLSLQDYRSAAGVSKWIAELGVVDATLPRDGVATSLAFFAQRMPRLTVEMAVDFMRAMGMTTVPFVPGTY